MDAIILMLFNEGKYLLYSCSFFIIALIICFLWQRRRFSRVLLALTLLVFYFCANGVIPSLLVKQLEQGVTKVSVDDIRTHRAMVVLGGGISASPFSTEPGLISFSRLVEAVSIYQKAKSMGITYTVFVSGGVTSSSTVSEAMQFKQLLIQMGVPSEQIVTEDKSRNTFENARFLAPLLKKYQFSSIVLVTDATHMKRAKKDFECFNFSVTTAPSSYPWPYVSWKPVSYNLTILDIAMHEIAGAWEFSLYRWLGISQK